MTSEPVTAIPGGVLTKRPAGSRFVVHLDVFEGPFDVLLGLIGKHRLDITEVALAQVTDEFIAHIRTQREASRWSGGDAEVDHAGVGDGGVGDAERQGRWELGEASEFLLVAATLLDLKASRLLPQRSTEDEEDLALLEARDLLFARLLQYRAFKDIAAVFAQRMAAADAFTPRQTGLEPHFAALLPELVMGITPEQLAMVAARALQERPVPSLDLDHLHAPAVSVREQADILVRRLRRDGSCSFRSLVADAGTTAMIVARFLAVLELFRESVVAVDQGEALGELTVCWIGDDDTRVSVSDEFDEGEQ